MTNLRADRDQPRPHPHIRVHAQHQEPRRVQAVVAHVDHLLALELDRVGVHQARDDERLLGARHAVQRQLPAQPPAAARVAHLGDRADDARILLGLEPALQLHVHQAVVRAQPLGVDLDAERGAEPDPPVGDLGLDLPDEPAGLAPHRVQARSRLGPEARLLGDDAPARHAAMVFQMGRKSKELYALCMQRIAIVNRGEATMRLIVAARELPSVRTIALFTDADRRALFVREADERFHIGPAAAYLDLDRLAEALRRTRADAAWVGWASSPRTPPSPTSARASASPSSARAPRPCAASATRSRPSGSPRRSACRSRPGAAAPSRRSRRRTSMRAASASPSSSRPAPAAAGPASPPA